MFAKTNHFHSGDSLHLLCCDAASLVFAEHSETLLVMQTLKQHYIPLNLYLVPCLQILVAPSAIHDLVKVLNLCMWKV